MQTLKRCTSGDWRFEKKRPHHPVRSEFYMLAALRVTKMACGKLLDTAEFGRVEDCS
jgi:hypothetical protein